MFVWKAKNEVFFDDNVGGKGKYFKTRFLQPGLVKYSFGVCELDKKTIDRFIDGFVGCPVIIDHNDVTDNNAKELSCGNICHVWFNEEDGWFWGDGIITSEEAVDLIKKQGYNVSCQYEITEYKENIKDDLHNGNPFDKIILNGRPEHLAIVKNPRYENAMIAVNAIEVDNGGPGSGRKSFGEALDDANKKYEEDKPVQKEEERDIQEELRQNRTQTHFQREELKGRNIIDAMNEVKEEVMGWFKRDDVSDKDVKRALSELKEDGILKAFFACNKKDDDDDGKWITVKGTHIFIPKGQDVDEVIEKKLGDTAKKDSLKGKYAKEDADFDPKQLKKDIKQAQKQGYKSAEDIADYLGLDIDEVSETLSPTDKKEHKFDEEGFEKFKKEKRDSMGKSSAREAKEMSHEQLRKWQDSHKLSQAQKNAIADYTGDLYRQVGQYLRGDLEDIYSEGFVDKIKKTVKELDSSMQPLPQNTRLYHVMDKDTLSDLVDNSSIGEDLIRKTFDNKSFTSTSYTKDNVFYETLSRQGSSSPSVLLNINTPEGTKATFAEPHTLDQSEEREVILDRNMQYTITRVQQTDDGFWQIDCDVKQK